MDHGLVGSGSLETTWLEPRELGICLESFEESFVKDVSGWLVTLPIAGPN